MIFDRLLRLLWPKPERWVPVSDTTGWDGALLVTDDDLYPVFDFLGRGGLGGWPGECSNHSAAHLWVHNRLNAEGACLPMALPRVLDHRHIELHERVADWLERLVPDAPKRGPLVSAVDHDIRHVWEINLIRQLDRRQA